MLYLRIVLFFHERCFMRFFRNSKRFGKILLVQLAGVAVLLVIFNATIWEPNTFQVNHHTLALKNWHPEHDGLRAAILSDIHLENDRKAVERLQKIIRTTNEAKPDLILLLGDFLGGTMDWQRKNADPQQIAGLLKNLSAPYGVYAVLGNHDWWLNGYEMRNALQQAGIHVLENEAETIMVNGKPLNIIGLPDAGTRGRFFDPDVLPDNSIPSLVMAHDPDSFRDHPELPYELMFCGHTHGGQVQLPLMGAVTSSSPLLSTYTEGLYHRDGRKLFVTRGLGTSLAKVRFLCLPEIVIMTLRCQ